MSPVYKKHPKHKWPKGFGSICPHLSEVDAQKLLDRSVSIADDSGAVQRWVVYDVWVFRALSEDHGATWHGHPVIGADVPDRVMQQLVAAGHISDNKKRKLRKQDRLPASGKRPGEPAVLKVAS